MPDKIHFRKLKNGRVFWKISGTNVVEVTSKLHDCGIRILNGPAGELMANSIVNDYFEATEAEFNAEFKDVNAVIGMQKIV